MKCNLEKMFILRNEFIEKMKQDRPGSYPELPVDLRKKDSQLWDYADTFILSNMGSNIVSWNFWWLGKDVLAKLIKEEIKKKNNPNFVLQQMFNLIDEQLWIKPFTTKEKIKRWVQSAAWATTWGATITKIGASELVEDINE